MAARDGHGQSNSHSPVLFRLAALPLPLLRLAAPANNSYCKCIVTRGGVHNVIFFNWLKPLFVFHINICYTGFKYRLEISFLLFPSRPRTFPSSRCSCLWWRRARPPPCPPSPSPPPSPTAASSGPPAGPPGPPPGSSSMPTSGRRR